MPPKNPLVMFIETITAQLNALRTGQQLHDEQQAKSDLIMQELNDLKTQLKSQKETMQYTAEKVMQEFNAIKSSMFDQSFLLRSVNESTTLLKSSLSASVETAFEQPYNFDTTPDAYQMTQFEIVYNSEIDKPSFYHSIMDDLTIQFYYLDKTKGNKKYTGQITGYNTNGTLYGLILDNVSDPYFIKSSTKTLYPNNTTVLVVKLYKYLAYVKDVPNSVTPLTGITTQIYKDDVLVEDQFTVTVDSSYNCSITPSLTALSGDYTLSYKIGEVETNKINFSVQASLFIELPADRDEYIYKSNLIIKAINVFGPYICTLTKQGDTESETLTCNEDLIEKGIITSSKQFSTEYGNYDLSVILTTETYTVTSTHHFKLLSPYKDTYNSFDEITIVYNTTFKNTTTNGDDVIVKAGEKFIIPLATADTTYSWTLSDGLNGAFTVSKYVILNTTKNILFGSPIANYVTFQNMNTDKLVLYLESDTTNTQPFATGKIEYCDKKYAIKHPDSTSPFVTSIVAPLVKIYMTAYKADGDQNVNAPKAWGRWYINIDPNSYYNLYLAYLFDHNKGSNSDPDVETFYSKLYGNAPNNLAKNQKGSDIIIKLNEWAWPSKGSQEKKQKRFEICGNINELGTIGLVVDGDDLVTTVDLSDSMSVAVPPSPWVNVIPDDKNKIDYWWIPETNV
jgi:hypothetical protein